MALYLVRDNFGDVMQVIGPVGEWTAWGLACFNPETGVIWHCSPENLKPLDRGARELLKVFAPWVFDKKRWERNRRRRWKLRERRELRESA